jgi:hypothetical protein
VSGAHEGPRPVVLDRDRLEGEARRKIGKSVYAYDAGGAKDEDQLPEHVAAWRRWRLRPQPR